MKEISGHGSFPVGGEGTAEVAGTEMLLRLSQEPFKRTGGAAETFEDSESKGGEAGIEYKRAKNNAQEPNTVTSKKHGSNGGPGKGG